MIRVRCRHCDRQFQLRDEAAGKKGYCPNPECRKPFRVPTPKNEPVEEEATATSTPKRNRSKKPSKRADLPRVPQGRKTSRKHSSKRKKKQKSVGYSVWGATSGVIVLAALGIWFWIQSDNGEQPAPNSVVAAEKSDPFAHIDFGHDITPFFQKYCVDCHSTDYQEGDFNFDRYTSAEAVKKDRDVWKKVLHLVELGAMPPSESDQPESAELTEVTDWIDHQLFYVDCSVPIDPGRVTVRRLNRTEYNNTVRDLLHVDFNPAADFPSDDVGYGFDNIGDVLSVPPLMIEKYLSAAEDIVDKAIPTSHPEYFHKQVKGKELKEEGAVSARGNGSKAIVSRGRVLYQFNLPEKAKYKVRIDAQADQAGDELAKMELQLDNKTLKTVEIKGHKKTNQLEFEFEFPKGKHTLSAAFINDFFDKDAKTQKDRNLIVDFLEIEGPLGIPQNLIRANPLLQVYPKGDTSVTQAATANLRDFLPRAFRRPATAEEVERYAGLAQMASEHGAPFEKAMQIAVQAILVSPDFLFRVEGGRQQVGDQEQLDDFALASRLSYFLWGSMPDDELFQLAASNELHRPEVLEAQTKRMLKDPKVEALVTNFSGQWLGLRKLTTNEVAPSPDLFPDFNDSLRKDMWKETELFFGSVVMEDQSIYDLLDGRYSFLNERLAKLYGIEGVQGEKFRKVNFEDNRRMGVVTHGSILTLTSYPNRTSPVKRGQWVLENLLNDAPPDPPPVVPALEETQTANPNLSFREQLVLHRKDPGCAACHVTMDEIGFGLENFDPIGRWRTKDGNFDVDSSGKLPGGETFNGPAEMISILRTRKAQFGRCLTEKLMIFALGRGIEYYDKCAIDKVMADMERDDRFSTLISGIVRSAPFQMRRPASAASE